MARTCRRGRPKRKQFSAIRAKGGETPAMLALLLIGNAHGLSTGPAGAPFRVPAFRSSVPSMVLNLPSQASTRGKRDGDLDEACSSTPP
jgi:hypothetical protein